MCTSAAAASSAAPRAVECPVSAARSASSSRKVASCTSRSAPYATRRVISQGALSPASTTLRPRRVSPITCSGATPSTVSPRWRRPKSGPGVTPSSRGALGVEVARAAGPRRARSRARAARGPPRTRRSGSRRGRARRSGSSSTSAHLERRVARSAARAPRTAARSPAGPYTVSGALALAQAERLEHPRQPEHVVGVEVGEEDLLELDQPDRAHELALGALAAVEQQPVAAAPHERARAGRAARWAPSRRCRGRGRRDPWRPILTRARSAGQSSGTSSNDSGRPRPVASPMVCRGRAAALGGAARVEDLEPVVAPRGAAGASGRTPRRRRARRSAPQPLEPAAAPGRRRGPSRSAPRPPPRPARPAAAARSSALSTLPWTAAHAAGRSARAREASSTVSVAGVEQQIRRLDPLDARVRQPPRPARQMGVRDHGDQHAAD